MVTRPLSTLWIRTLLDWLSVAVRTVLPRYGKVFIFFFSFLYFFTCNCCLFSNFLFYSKSSFLLFFFFFPGICQIFEFLAILPLSLFWFLYTWWYTSARTSCIFYALHLALLPKNGWEWLSVWIWSIGRQGGMIEGRLRTKCWDILYMRGNNINLHVH